MRPLVMGVLNVTPDSFSDGGRFLDQDAAIAQGLRMAGEGADVIDVGGESTRPGASEVPVDVELGRVLPVISALAGHVRVSVDTRKPEVAAAAVEAGASLINDVSASLWPIAAASGSGWVAMHMQGSPATMQLDPRYGDVVAEVAAFLGDRAVEAASAGVREIWLDPGIGFGKTLEHNLSILHDLNAIVGLGHPVVVGTSRKGFLGRLLGGAGPDDRLEGSLGTAVWAMTQGARMVRVHDVAATVQAATLVGDGPADAAALR